MAIAVTINSVGPSPIDFTAAELIVYGSLVFSGSYPTAGDVMNLSGFDQIKSNEVPLHVEIYEAPPAGTSPTGYTYIFCPGTTLANGQVAIFNGTTQVSAGAYPAGITGAVVQFRAWFQNL
jgi:hypothetical protein